MDARAAPDATRRRRATLALLLVSVIWGISFLWLDSAVGASRRVLGSEGVLAGCALFLVLRFAISTALLALVSKRARTAAAGAWSGGAWLALLLTGGFFLQLLGLDEVTPAVSAFLTSLYVLFLALLGIALERRAPRPALILGALLATAGAGLVRGRPEIAAWRTGEGLTVLCALFFALHILATDRVTRRVEPLRATLAMFAWVAVFATIVLVACTLRPAGPSWPALVELASQGDFQLSIVLNAVLASAFALSLMNLYQRDLDPVRAAILYALEPIWAVLAGVAVGTDRITGWLAVGGLLLLAGNLVADVLGTRKSAS